MVQMLPLSLLWKALSYCTISAASFELPTVLAMVVSSQMGYGIQDITVIHLPPFSPADRWLS